MDVIYVDSIFLLNMTIDYFMLLASAKVSGLVLRRGRYALAAAFGAVYAVLSAFPELSFLKLPPIMLCAGALMSLLAFFGERRILRVTLTFFLVAAAFGGAVFAAGMLTGKSFSGGVFINVPMRVLILSFAVSYFVLTIVFRRLGRQTAKALHTVAIEYNGKKSVFRALHDTGNELFDPVTGSDVLVAERDSVAPLFGEEEKAAILDDKLDPVEALLKFGPGMRLLPYSAVGTGKSLLLAFRPETILIDGKARKDVIVALSPTKFCESGEYSAVL